MTSVHFQVVAVTFRKFRLLPQNLSTAGGEGRSSAPSPPRSRLSCSPPASFQAPHPLHRRARPPAHTARCPEYHWTPANQSWLRSVSPDRVTAVLRTYRDGLHPLKGVAMTTRPLDDVLCAERQVLLEPASSHPVPRPPVQAQARLTWPRSSIKVSPLLKLPQLTGTSVALRTRRPLTCNSRSTSTSLVTTWRRPEATPPFCGTERRSGSVETGDPVIRIQESRTQAEEAEV